MYDIVTDERNILLAYRCVKSNKGSKTAGVNGKTIINWQTTAVKDYVAYVRKRLQNYFPHKVRRVEIPKPDGKMRPLGIPTMEDRLIQQCIKQVLEPIVEAKFYDHSYGFRPNRSAHHAKAELCRMVNQNHLFYVVEVDIKGFFDNVDHGKLLKQLWALGIQDKRLLAIISKMLKAEIAGIGKPDKGTPQGGILSPLLANVVLNELDFWIEGQWRQFSIKEFSPLIMRNGKINRGDVYRKLRKKTALKEMYIVRYADDFKILCPTHEVALAVFEATKAWLYERLKLEVNEEKSGVLDIRKKCSKFLGFEFKARLSKGKWVLYSHMCKKAIEQAKELLRKRILEIKESATPATVHRYNSTVLGLQEYYQHASHVNLDFNEIAYSLLNFKHNQLKGVMSSRGTVSSTYIKRYGKSRRKKEFVAGVCLFPVGCVRTVHDRGFSQKTCNYTVAGREGIHRGLKINTYILHYLMEHAPEGATAELADNRISLYSAQWGKCRVSGKNLEIGYMELHHIIPKENGGTDKYSNLVWLTADVHKLIHATVAETVEKYLKACSLDNEAITILNKFRKQVGNCVIE